MARPLLGPTDPLPARPRRVVVAGTSGAGKTTLARAIGRTLGLPHTETDALFHGAGWTRRPEFDADIAALVAAERWVTEYGYDDARPLLLARCDLFVALHLPVALVMARLTRRTVRRRLRRERLWGVNVEPPLRTLFTDPEHILRWGWRTRHLVAERVEHARRTRPELPVVVLRSRAEVETWLAGPLAAAGR